MSNLPNQPQLDKKILGKTNMRTKIFLAVLLPLCLAAPFDDIANYEHSDVSQVKFNEQLRLLFKIMDIDQNRLIGAEELMLICLENDIDIPAAEAERIVTLPGFLTMDKFVELLADCPSHKTADILLYLVHTGGNGNRRERIQGFFNTWKSQFTEQIRKTKNKLFQKGNIGQISGEGTTVAPTTKEPSSTDDAITVAPAANTLKCMKLALTGKKTAVLNAIKCLKDLKGPAQSTPAPWTAASCSGNAKLLSTSPGQDMVLCKDETQETCREDLESLCPAGWNLCTPGQFNNRNDDWNYNWKDANAGQPLGVAYCWNLLGNQAAFQYGSWNPVLNTDAGYKCTFISNWPGCEQHAGRDCNRDDSALCCAPTKTCGDGEVQLEEDCDDGNDSNMDDCLNSCSWRYPDDHEDTECK